MGELQPVHRTRHVKVGKDEMNIVAGCKNGDGLVGIASLENVKSRYLDGGSGTNPDQKFVLDNKHDRSLASTVLHQNQRLWLGRAECRVSDTAAKRQHGLGRFVPAAGKI
jgi:hypothetical protein